jgi:A/G-specific adenine glycosylase
MRERGGAGGRAASFAARLTAWQAQHGRNDLPWQNTRDAYRIWLSEIMLQQTQVGTVLPYYLRFLERFPDVQSLAAAEVDEVLRLWSGLGYYSRARNLHRAARQVVAEHGGRFPESREALESLPGVGRSTAAAIAAFAYGRREAILDGNVKRVLARHFAIAGHPAESAVARRLWSVAEAQLPRRNIEGYSQALMDLGASICGRTADCPRCPVKDSCAALAQQAVADYPAPRPRRVARIRETAMLILVQEGRVLLRKRPPSGIWGGLWCFPEMAPGEDVHGHCTSRLGVALAEVREMPVLRHAFTHFTLNIRPLICLPAGPAHWLQSGGDVWLPLDEAPRAAVPTPVRKLLQAL